MPDGGGTKTSYAQSPEQRQIYQLLYPVIQRLAGAAVGGTTRYPTSIDYTFTPGLANAGLMGGADQSSYMNNPLLAGLSRTYPNYFSQITNMPGYNNTLTSGFQLGMGNQGGMGMGPGTWTSNVTYGEGEPISLYDIPEINIPEMYQIPDIGMMMPQAGWFENLDPNVKEGLWEPWMEAGEQMREFMGSRGQLGAPSSGYTGAFGVGMGELMDRAGRGVGLQAWNMINPALQRGWGAQLGRAQQGWEAQLGANQWLANQQVSRGMMPWQILPGLLGGTYSTPIVQQGGGIGGAMTGGLGGALAGGLAGNAIGGTVLGLGAGPFGAIAGGLGGLLGGLF